VERGRIVVRGASGVPAYADNKVFLGVEVKGEAVARGAEVDGAAGLVVLDIVCACLQGCVAAGDHKWVVRSQEEVVRASSLDVGRERIGGRGSEGGGNGREPKDEGREDNHGEE
jgi:hypothetical protein